VSSPSSEGSTPAIPLASSPAELGGTTPLPHRRIEGGKESDLIWGHHFVEVHLVILHWRHRLLPCGLAGDFLLSDHKVAEHREEVMDGVNALRCDAWRRKHVSLYRAATCERMRRSINR
jgi:hypothetical protein